ncbi:hypothetical protein [Pedomonas mirosovicensis]|uniref:hypothetical protein n=1 Tax=Pedomonas mirosovicensis TaxID=2908641 RepID=UPI00216A6E05|nr:hypothetical protein [Pedomonas mirosovicensis]MCH8683844.1 hypothetical protein [Pedomonas mirosovicensis]
MDPITDLHLEHFRQLYLNERSRRETIRSSVSTPVAALSFAVFAFSTLAVEIDLARWQEPVTLLILLLSALAAAALFASAYQIFRAEWLFVYHEPPRLIDLIGDARAAEPVENIVKRTRRVLTASYAVAYEQYLQGNALSSRSRTWALRLILVSLLLQVAAFMLLPFHLAK